MKISSLFRNVVERRKFYVPVFAQQVTSLVAMVLVVFVILYITVAFRKKKQPV